MRRIVGWTTAVLGGLWFALGCIGNFQTAQSIIQDRGATVRAIYQTMPWSQWVGLAIFLSGIALLIWSYRRHFDLTESDQDDGSLTEKLPRKAYFTSGSKTLSYIAQAHVPKPVRIEKPPFNSQAVLIKVRDLVVSTEKQPSSERFDVIGALIKFADEFETEEQVEWVCAELEQRQFKDPFRIMASAVPGIFDGRKLEFLCDARTAKIEIRTTMSAMSFVTKYWRHSDEFNKAHRAHFEPPTHAQGQRESRAMLNAIVDKLSAGVKPLRALQEVHADELDTNDMLLQVRDDLIKFGHPDPFRVIKDTIPQDKWLEFLQAARLQGLNLSNELQLLDLLQDKTPFIKPLEPAPQVFRKPTSPPIGDEIRDSICRKIKELIKGGDELLGRMMMGFPQIDAKFNQWSQRCEEYLRDSLSEDAVKLFRSPAIIPPDSNPIGGVTAAMLGEQWNPQRHLYERIASRVSRLREILNRVNEGNFC